MNTKTPFDFAIVKQLTCPAAGTSITPVPSPVGSQCFENVPFSNMNHHDPSGGTYEMTFLHPAAGVVFANSAKKANSPTRPINKSTDVSLVPTMKRITTVSLILIGLGGLMVVVLFIMIVGKWNYSSGSVEDTVVGGGGDGYGTMEKGLYMEKEGEYYRE